MRQRIVEFFTPTAVPLSYIGTYDFLTDPQKLVGFLVLVLQGVYIVIKILKETKGKNEQDSKDRRSDSAGRAVTNDA